MTKLFASSGAKVSGVGNLFSHYGDGCSPSFSKENTMSIASEVNAYRPIGVLLGGPFEPQHSIERKPVICALLRAPKRFAEAVDRMHSTPSLPTE